MNPGIEPRIRDLERSCRALRLWCTALSALLLVACLSSSVGGRVVRAERFVLTDPGGAERGLLSYNADGAFLRLDARDGSARVVVGAGHQVAKEFLGETVLGRHRDDYPVWGDVVEEMPWAGVAAGSSMVRQVGEHDELKHAECPEEWQRASAPRSRTASVPVSSKQTGDLGEADRFRPTAERSLPSCDLRSGPSASSGPCPIESEIGPDRGSSTVPFSGGKSRPLERNSKRRFGTDGGVAPDSGGSEHRTWAPTRALAPNFRSWFGVGSATTVRQHCGGLVRSSSRSITRRSSRCGIARDNGREFLLAVAADSCCGGAPLLCFRCRDERASTRDQPIRPAAIAKCGDHKTCHHVLSKGVWY